MKQLPLFASLSEEEMDLLAAKSELVVLNRKEVLFEVGDPAAHAFLLLSGSLKLTRPHPEGRERIVHLFLRGDLLGAAVAIQDGTYPASAVALEQSVVMKIEQGSFGSLFLNHPKIGKTLIAQMGERIQQAHMDRLGTFNSVEKRIAHFLLDLLKQVCIVYGPTSRITIPLTRQEIADRIGSSVETVIRIMSLWSKTGWIQTSDQMIEISDPKRLMEIVERDN